MSTLTSAANPALKRWRRLLTDAAARRESGEFIIEGLHLVEEAIRCGVLPQSLMLAEAALERPETRALLRQLEGDSVRSWVLADRLFESIFEVSAARGIAASLPIPAAPTDLDAFPQCVLLEQVQDAGNVGTILRSAAAFGIDCVVLDAASADPWSPKCVRAAQGAHFSIRLMRTESLAGVLRGRRGSVIGTVPVDGRPLPSLALEEPLAWLFGSEGRGITPEALALCTERVSIPMPGAAESLNVAMAASICFYERARRAAPGRV